MPSTTRSIMRYIFKDSILEKYSYKGLKIKKVFYTLSICSIIFGKLLFILNYKFDLFYKLQYNNLLIWVCFNLQKQLNIWNNLVNLIPLTLKLGDDRYSAYRSNSWVLSTDVRVRDKFWTVDSYSEQTFFYSFKLWYYILPCRTMVMYALVIYSFLYSS